MRTSRSRFLSCSRTLPPTESDAATAPRFALLHRLTAPAVAAGVLFVSVLLLSALALRPRSAHAQDTGAVAGVVVNAESGETLPGANVVVAGTQQGASTDIDGRYRIDGLAPGIYNLEFSFVSYQAKTVTGVEVSAGETATLDVTLQPATQELEEVVVTAEVARNSEAGLLRERQKAAAVSNAISAEEISESGSSNAADAMQKVTGASVVGGKHVNIRGLGGRYVNTTLNGASLPSADPDGNSVQFDLFPSSLLENIVTSKTFTPDRAGDFTGGSIDIGTVAFPGNLNVTASSSIGYNTQVGFADDMLLVRGGLDEVPDVAQDLPVGFPSGDVERRQIDEAIDAFGSTLMPSVDGAPVDQSYEASFGNEFTLFGDRPLGVVASASYDQNVSAYDDGVTGIYPSASGGESLSREQDLRHRSGSTEEVVSGLMNLSFRPFEKHELGLNVLYTRTDEREAHFREGFDNELTTSSDTTSIFQTRSLRKIERNLLSGQARGEHTFAQGLSETLLGASQGLRLEWNAALTRTQQDEPDFRLFATEFDRATGEYATFGTTSSVFELPARYFRTLEESTRSGNASLSVPVTDAVEGKVGGSYTDKTREFRERQFQYDPPSDARFEGSDESLFGDRAGCLDSECDELGVLLRDNTEVGNNYDGAQTITAGFAMADVQMGRLLEALGAGSSVPVLSRLRIIGGARMEHTDQTIEVADAENPDYPLEDSLFVPADQLDNAEPGDGEIVQTNWLPSVNLVYAVTDEMNVRAAYGRTLARPSFKEFAPVRFTDFIGGADVQGNPELQLTLTDNFDLRWEWFPSAGELLAVSGFYKSFSRPIVQIFDDLAFNRTLTFTNATDATVYGAEFEARKRLGFLDEALQNVKAGANLTLARSNAAFADSLGLEDRRLQGQSDVLVNADLSYENPDVGTSVGIYYNFFGERLAAITRDQGPPRFEQPRHTLDVIASQRMAPLGLGGLKVTLKAKNLLGADHEVTRELNGESFTVERYPLGRSFSFGLEYSL